MTEAHPTPPPKAVSSPVPQPSSAKPTKEEKIDQQVANSFPASDPPSFSGGNHIIGAPVARETDAPTGSHPDVVEAQKKVHSGDAEVPETY